MDKVIQYKKPIFIVSIAFVLAALTLVIIFINTDTAQKQATAERNNEYRVANTHVYSLGEKIVLDSSEDDAGSEYGYVASFGWVGSMELTVQDVQIFDSPDDAGIGYEGSPPSGYNEREWRFVLFDVAMKNLNADYESEEQKDYLISFIKLRVNNSVFLPPVEGSYYEIEYFSGTRPDATATQMYHYLLGKGEGKVFQIGYFIPVSDLEKDSYFVLGKIPNIEKYKINLDLRES